MRILLAAAGIFFALIFVKWRHWKEYYPTVLFMLVMNLTMSMITRDHRLWIFLPSSVLTTHTLSDPVHTFITFPATVLLFLSYYPHRLRHQVYFTAAWAALYSWTEFFFSYLGLMTYDNGWSIVWSTLFNCAMFPILRLHYLNPIMAWALSGLILALIWSGFGFSSEMLK